MKKIPNLILIRIRNATNYPIPLCGCFQGSRIALQGSQSRHPLLLQSIQTVKTVLLNHFYRNSSQIRSCGTCCCYLCRQLKQTPRLLTACSFWTDSGQICARAQALHAVQIRSGGFGTVALSFQEAGTSAV